MVTQEIMDRWMDGGIIFSNNSLKKKMRGFFFGVCFYCMNFLH